MQIPDPVLSKAFEWALAYARSKNTTCDETQQVLTDAVVDCLMWCRDHCDNPDTFCAFVKSATRRWVSRSLSKLKLRRSHRPEVGMLPDVAAREAKPLRPMIIEELPPDLAFIVRLYMVDSYTLREIGLLVDKSANTVDKMLKHAAELLAPGRRKPERRKGEKRLSAG